MRTSIWQAAVGAIGGALLVGLGPELWKWAFENKPPIEYKILVYSSAENNPPLPRAAVELTEGEETVSHETSPDGVSTFLLASDQGGRTASLRVTRGGFRTLARSVRIPTSSAAEHVYLEPESGSERPVQLEKVFSSGPKPSGLGSNWRGYQLCSEPAPEGYTIGAVDFSLKGDRSCGAWAECREIRRTPSVVCYSFELQGHDEWSPPRPAFSEGILKVTFVRG